MVPLAVSVAGREVGNGGLSAPLRLDDLVAGAGQWEVELGVGKGRFLLARAAAHPERKFLGVELVSEYYRLVARRSGRRRLDNLAVVRGDALYVAAALLPRAFAAAVHVYFPDPWPKTRHRRRRLFDEQSVDLVLGLLRPGGELYFATDFLKYGEAVLEILAGYPNLALSRLAGWPEGARTHYEAKYMLEGRPILRARASLESPALAPHPRGEAGAANAWAPSVGRPYPRALTG